MRDFRARACLPRRSILVRAKRGGLRAWPAAFRGGPFAPARSDFPRARYTLASAKNLVACARRTFSRARARRAFRRRRRSRAKHVLTRARRAGARRRGCRLTWVRIRGDERPKRLPGIRSRLTTGPVSRICRARRHIADSKPPAGDAGFAGMRIPGAWHERLTPAPDLPGLNRR
jgi:hypothetical protein